MFKGLIDKVRGTRQTNPYYESLLKDWGKPDVYGPWTTVEDMNDEEDNPRGFKRFYLVTPDEPCVIEPISKND